MPAAMQIASAACLDYDRRGNRRNPMPISRRVLMNTAALGAAAAFALRFARAAYPERPIRLIVPFPAGGAVDAVGRLLGNALTAHLGQPIVIEDRGAAGGIVGIKP